MSAEKTVGAGDDIMGRSWRFENLYLNFALKSFQKQLAYKFEYFVGVFNGLLFVFIFTSLWRTVYSAAAHPVNSGFDFAGIMAYAVFAMIIRISMTMDDMSVITKIRSGAISMDMIKPMNYFGMTLAEAGGQSMFHWFTRAAPIMLVCLPVFGISLPTDPSRYVLLGVSWILGYMILFMINFLFGLIAFWTIETFSFQLMKYGAFTLLSGGVIPVDFFPGWAKPFVDATPFKYILYVPTALFTGHIVGAQALWLIAWQCVWVAGLGVACQLAWRLAQRKLVVQGG